jgi:hypothetical protein
MQSDDVEARRRQIRLEADELRKRIKYLDEYIRELET